MTFERDIPAHGPPRECGADLAGPSGTEGHPLGPLLRTVPIEHAVTGRLYAGGVLTVAAALLITAARLVPAHGGMGTHAQLGLPPCGFVLVTGFPCPTCGMTTAYAYTVRGRIVSAMRAQPAGCALAIATLVAGLAAGYTLVSGRRPSVNWYRVNPVHCVWWTTALLVGAWAFKILLGLSDRTLPVR